MLFFDSWSWGTKLVVLWIVAFTISTGFFIRANTQRIRDINQLRLQTCYRTNVQLQKLIRPQLTVLPTLAYYKTHPYELQQALNRTQQALDQTSPSKCKEEK